MSAARPPLVIAHRGASGRLPENTLPAYELAVELGADMIEVDLHRTRDGAIVVTHDEDLRGLGGVGEVADATLADVRALDAGGGAQVPTLEELLDGFGARISLNLEIKRGAHTEYESLEAATLAALEARGLVARTLFSSFYDPVLARLRGLSERARIGLLISRRFPDGWAARARRLGAEALHPELALVTPELVRAAHDEGLAVHVYTVDAPGDLARMIELEVDGIFTNHPDRLRGLLEASPRGHLTGAP